MDDIRLEKGAKAAAQSLVNKLNERIAQGNDKIAFSIALLLALTKDFLDIILTLTMIGLIPGVNFVVGLFLTTFLFLFMMGKGWFLNWRFRIMYWVLGLFIDGLPAVSALPMNTILVLYAWRNIRKRKAKAEIHLQEVHTQLQEIETMEEEENHRNYESMMQRRRNEIVNEEVEDTEEEERTAPHSQMVLSRRTLNLQNARTQKDNNSNSQRKAA